MAEFAGILQADAYAGFNRLYEPKREPGPILEAACWAHARRKLFEIAAVSNCLVAERCWDQARWAVEAYAWRFDGFDRLSRAGGGVP